MMEEYMVEIRELSVKTIPVMARNLCEAEKLAEEKWKASKVILDENDFMEASFCAMNE